VSATPWRGSKPYRPDAVRRDRLVNPATFEASTTPRTIRTDVTWDAATLDKYLVNPRAMVPDTSMIYAGLKNDAERADLIAYLETLH
jgi:cytochrome c2